MDSATPSAAQSTPTAIPPTIDIPADQRPLAEPTSESLREFLADRDLGAGMLAAYVRDVFPGDLTRWEILSVESEWTRELLPSYPQAGSRKRFPIGLDAAGRVDLLVRDRESGARLIVDHKTS